MQATRNRLRKLCLYVYVAIIIKENETINLRKKEKGENMGAIKEIKRRK